MNERGRLALAAADYAAWLVLFLATVGLAKEPELSRIKPKEPNESLETFRTPPGFKIEQVATEPLVCDPIALEFDENGRAYVIELRSYNQYAKEGAQKAESGSEGIRSTTSNCDIRLLEDTDGDGKFDWSVVFAEDLNYPTGLFCYDGGLLVGDAPDLLFLKDTDADGRADHREVLLTGFGRDAGGEGQLNSFRWRLDNRIELSLSQDGGNILLANQLDVPPQQARNRNMIFDPRSRKFELTSGGGQHGLSFDDWGRPFVCDNSDPVRLVIYDDRYLTRNPWMVAPPPSLSIAPDGKHTKLMRISPTDPWRIIRTKLRSEGKAAGPDEGGQPSGFFTAATGITVYRGDAWPEQYRGNLLVGEPANNLVYRAKLVDSKGPSLVARRADPEAEFLASTDTWFRPIQFAHGPDGALYVIDMYRELIEGAAFLPPELLKQMDPVAGNDRGRIYKITHCERPARPSIPKRLSECSTSLLVSLLEHRNGWHRDTAARLLYERQDPAAIEALRQMSQKSKLPFARMQAFYALKGINALTEYDVLNSLTDHDPRVREHGVRLAESFAHSSQQIPQELVKLSTDPDALIRFQLAFSLGYFEPNVRDPALVSLIKHDSQSPWFRVAVQSSLGEGAPRVLRSLVNDEAYRQSSHGRDFLEALAQQIGTANRPDEIREVVQTINNLLASNVSVAPIAKTILTGLLQHRSRIAKQILAEASTDRTKQITSELLTDARTIALDEEQSNESRVAAVLMMGCTDFLSAETVYAQLLESRIPLPIQEAVLNALGSYTDTGVANLLLSTWPKLTPRLRMSVVDVLVSRPIWAERLLDAIEKGAVSRNDIDAARLMPLRSHPDAKLREAIARLLNGTGISRRADVVADYKKVLQRNGNIDRGRAAFRKVCAACHQLEGFGTAIGADLHAIRDRGRESVLLNILDPNREVKPQYLTYLVVTIGGKSATGMITEETPNSLVLRKPDGGSITLRRADIELLQTSGLSYMPEGFEKQLDYQTMADLLAFLDAVK